MPFNFGTTINVKLSLSTSATVLPSPHDRRAAVLVHVGNIVDWYWGQGNAVTRHMENMTIEVEEPGNDF